MNKNTNLAAVAFIRSNSAKRMDHPGNYEMISTVNALKAVEIAVKSEREKAGELFAEGMELYVGKELARVLKKTFLDTLRDFYDLAGIKDQMEKIK